MRLKGTGCHAPISHGPIYKLTERASRSFKLRVSRRAYEQGGVRKYALSISDYGHWANSSTITGNSKPEALVLVARDMEILLEMKCQCIFHADAKYSGTILPYKVLPLQNM
jgi:hypothetical protein